MMPLLTSPRLALLAAGTLLLGSSLASAQIQFPAASPAATIKQVVGVTSVEVEYSRPSMRGRSIFGGLVPYGSVWRTGANAASKITFQHDILFAGQPVPAGTYGLFSVPGEGQWEVILSSSTELWGAAGYDDSKDVARAIVAPIHLVQPVETFFIGFESLRDDSASLILEWEHTRVAVPLKTTDEARIFAAIRQDMPPVAEANLGLLYNAARYYRIHNGDLELAQRWINAALSQRPTAYWIAYEKAQIEAARGELALARTSANAALESASDQGADPGMLYEIGQFISGLGS